jgi:hypothetical protein
LAGGSALADGVNQLESIGVTDAKKGRLSEELTGMSRVAHQKLE